MKEKDSGRAKSGFLRAPMKEKDNGRAWAARGSVGQTLHQNRQNLIGAKVAEAGRREAQCRTATAAWLGGATHGDANVAAARPVSLGAAGIRDRRMCEGGGGGALMQCASLVCVGLVPHGGSG